LSPDQALGRMASMSTACRDSTDHRRATEDAGVVGGGEPLTIQQASELLAVPVTTLRSWERRYDMPMTSRTSGGHRRYTSLALDELRLMRDEIARGKRAGEAAVSARLLLQPTQRARPFIDTILSAAEAMDPARIRTSLDEAVSELGLGAALDEALMPAMRRIGRWWEAGRCDVGHEHLVTEAVRVWLGKLIAFAPEPVRLEPVVLACGPHDAHSVGLEALCALLVSEGRLCLALGARTPAAALLDAASRVDAVAVVVVSHLAVGRRAAVDAIRAVSASGVRTFYAGNAFMAAPVRRRIPGTYLGESLRSAARMVEWALGPGS
jgi:MerR family transcriptional regulator, light-induced transcriptional regulator